MTNLEDPVDLDNMIRIGIHATKVNPDDFDHLDNLLCYANTGLAIITSEGIADLANVDKVVRFMRKHTNQLAIKSL